MMRLVFTAASLLGLISAFGLLHPSAGAQDYTRPPEFGEVELIAGFEDDPYIMLLQGGGALPASDVAEVCAGYVGSAPDFRVYYESGAGVLPLIISARAQTDIALLISTPDGAWYCDDDSAEDGRTPVLRFNAPQTGQYDVWIAVKSRGVRQTAELRVSEISHR